MALKVISKAYNIKIIPCISWLFLLKIALSFAVEIFIYEYMFPLNVNRPAFLDDGDSLYFMFLDSFLKAVFMMEQ